MKLTKYLWLCGTVFFLMTTWLSICASDVVVVKDSLIGVPYKITLYDVKPILEAQICASGGEAKAVDIKKFLHVTHKNGTFESTYLSCSDKLLSSIVMVDKVSRFCRVRKYDKERIKIDIIGWMDFFEKKKQCNLYQLGVKLKKKIKKNRSGENYEQDFGNVPVVLCSNGNVFRDRANLFDMFSFDVDKYLFTHGFGETISHENHINGDAYQEDQFQISMLGAIEIESWGYFSFGVFQYTFSASGVCYHRAFKPWTSSCLKRLSNSMTQILVKNAFLGWLGDLITREPVLEVEVDILKKFGRYNFSETCINELGASF